MARSPEETTLNGVNIPDEHDDDMNTERCYCDGSWFSPMKHWHSAASVDKVFRKVCDSIQADWRNLARRLGVIEEDIAKIQSARHSDYSGASFDMLYRFFEAHQRSGRSHAQMFQYLVTALLAIRRYNLANQIVMLVVQDSVL